jgi:hypothetical protein
VIIVVTAFFVCETLNDEAVTLAGLSPQKVSIEFGRNASR